MCSRAKPRLPRTAFRSWAKAAPSRSAPAGCRSGSKWAISSGPRAALCIGRTSRRTPFDLDKPFLSETGYRSFFGLGAEPFAGITPEEFAIKVIATHVGQSLKDKLVMIRPE
jgi:hypothetical protein